MNHFSIIFLLGCMLEYESFHFKIVTTFYVEGTLDKIFGTVFKVIVQTLNVCPTLSCSRDV